MTFLRTVALGATAALAVLTPAASPTLRAGDIDWSRHVAGLPFVVGMERGREECKFTGLAPMLFFTSATDDQCPIFAARTWKDEDVRAKVAGYTPILVDWDAADPELRKKCRADCVPTIAWLDHDEKWIWSCIGSAPEAIVRKEAEIARRSTPKPREPAAGMKTLAELAKKVEDAAVAKDVKAQLAALAEIRKIRLGESFQIAARAADERVTKQGMEAVEAVAPVLEDKKAASNKKLEAKKALEKILDDYGAEHPVGKAAAAAIEKAFGKQKPKK